MKITLTLSARGADADGEDGQRQSPKQGRASRRRVRSHGPQHRPPRAHRAEWK